MRSRADASSDQQLQHTSGRPTLDSLTTRTPHQIFLSCTHDMADTHIAQGNAHYKSRNYEQAAESFTCALEELCVRPP